MNDFHIVTYYTRSSTALLLHGFVTAKASQLGKLMKSIVQSHTANKIFLIHIPLVGFLTIHLRYRVHHQSQCQTSSTQ